MTEPSDDQLTRIESKLDDLDRKITSLLQSRQKEFEWLGVLSKRIQEFDQFQQEVRQSFEPLYRKLEDVSDLLRILRHATSDLSCRLEAMENDPTHLTKRSSA